MTKLSLKILTVLVLSAIWLIRCDDPSSQSQELLPLEGKIYFKFVEGNYSGLEPVILIALETEAYYPALGYSIELDVTYNNPLITINILGIKKPDGYALSAFGPAGGSILPELDVGNYDLRFIYEDSLNQYDLTLSDESIRTEPEQQSFMVLWDPLKWRYPHNSFVYYCSTTEESAWVYTDFSDSLRGRPLVEEFTFPDSGVIPYGHGTTGWPIDHPDLYFTYQDTNEYNRIREVFKSYSQNVISSLNGTVRMQITDFRAVRELSTSYD